MQAAILTIGNELLLGKTIDTNSAYLAETLTNLGYSVSQSVTVGDDSEDIIKAVRELLAQHDFLAVCGGLGPTDDDVTLESVAAAIERPIVIDAASQNKLKLRFADRGIPMPPSNVKQACIIEGAATLDNAIGLVPGSLVELDQGKRLILLPGVPREIRSILETDTAVRRLARPDSPVRRITFKRFKLSGITESGANDLLGPLMGGLLRVGVEIGYYASSRDVQVHMINKGTSAADCLERFAPQVQTVRGALAEYIYAEDHETIETVVADALRRTGKTIYLIEGHTGGLISMLLTSLPGSSEYFKGGSVIYGLDDPLLLEHTSAEARADGAINSAVAQQLTRRLRAVHKVDLCLFCFGLAGPSSGSSNLPVGTTLIGLSSSAGDCLCWQVCPGDREVVRWRAALLALHHLLRALKHIQAEKL